MKKITLLFLMMLSATFTFAQVGISENFDAGTPAGWTDSYANSAVDACAGNTERDNLYNFSTTGNLTTPNLVAASNATDLTVSFDYKIENWNTQDAAPAGWGSAELQYSTDDGTTWNTVLTIDDTNHVVANTCANMMVVIPAASLPAGSDVKLQIANTWVAGDYDFHVDNFNAMQVAMTAPNCDAVLSGMTVSGDVDWSAATGLPTGYRLTVGTATAGTDVADNVDVGNVLTYNVGALTAGTDYFVTITPYNANGDATGCTEAMFTVPCLDPTGASATNVTFESADLGWTENNGSMAWNVEWGADGFLQGEGTTVAATTNPHPLTGLMPSTAYDFYVQTDCGTATSAWVGPISFTTPAAPPANDDFANAEVMICGNTYMGDTSAATLDEDDAPDGASADLDAPNVWYSYTGSGTEEEVTLDLCTGSAYDTSVLVYTGTSGALTIVADNDDGAGCAGNTSLLTFVSDGTTTYYITIEGWNATSTGVFNMVTSCVAAAPAPANDDCANAEALTLGAATGGTTVGATVNVADANPTCESQFATIVDVWYTFDATVTGQVDITTAITGTSDQANVAVYTDCTLATQLACSDANGGETLNVGGLTEGTTYYVRVWGDGVAARSSGDERVTASRIEGTFDITVAESTLSTTGFDANTLFSYYPNPVKNSLTLNAQKEIVNVTVFNMVGQTVLRVAPNAISSDVDMSNFQAGAYFVQVTVGDAVETVKVIKK